MIKEHEDDDVSDDDDVIDAENDMDEEEDDEEEDEAYLKTVIKEILEEDKNLLEKYASDPQQHDEVAQNESIKKFVKIKALAKIMESFKCVMLWENDEQLRKLFKAYKHALYKKPDLEAEDAMRHVLKKDNNVEDVIERIIEEQVDADEDEEEEIEN